MRKIRNRMVYNDWGLYSFVQTLKYKCLRVGKELHIIDESYTSKTCHVCGHVQAMPLYKRTYRCANCGLVIERDEKSAHNIYQRFVARPGPQHGVLHTERISMQYANVFTAIDNVTMVEHI